MLRLYHNKKIKHYMVVDTVILRLYHNKTSYEGRYYHRKIISQEKHNMVFDILSHIKTISQ